MTSTEEISKNPVRDRSISATILPDGTITLSGVCMQANSAGDFTGEEVATLLSQTQKKIGERTMMAFLKNDIISDSNQIRLATAAVLIDHVELDGDAAIAHGTILDTPCGKSLAEIIKHRSQANEPTGIMFRSIAFGRHGGMSVRDADLIVFGVIIDSIGGK